MNNEECQLEECRFFDLVKGEVWVGYEVNCQTPSHKNLSSCQSWELFRVKK